MVFNTLDQRTEEMQEVDRRVRMRVLDGIKLLEEKHGKNWPESIDLDRLNLYDASYCVLGQLYHGYGKGLQSLGLDPLYSYDGGGQYGFNADGSLSSAVLEDMTTEEIMRQLQIAWEQEIRHRRL